MKDNLNHLVTLNPFVNLLPTQPNIFSSKTKIKRGVGGIHIIENNLIHETLRPKLKAKFELKILFFAPTFFMITHLTTL